MTLKELLVKIGLDVSGVDTGMAQLEDRFGKMGGKLVAGGAALTAGVTVPILAVGGASLKAGMDAVESENLFAESFKGMKNAARDWSEKTSDALGLNAFELRRNSGLLYTMLGSMGVAQQGAFDMATGITTLAADMASFYNMDHEEAFVKLRSGLTGETEPLKQLGILVDEATIKNVALAKGLVKVGEEMTGQVKVQARYIAIMEQTKNAQGDLARTLDSPTNKLRVLKEKITQASTEFGMALIPMLQAALPVVESLVRGVQSAVKVFGELPKPVQGVIVVVGLLAAAAGPVLLALGGMAMGMSAIIGLAPALTAGLGTSAVAVRALGASIAGLLGPIALAVSALAGLYAFSQTQIKGQTDADLQALVANAKKTGGGMALSRAKSAQDELNRRALAQSNALSAAMQDLANTPTPIVPAATVNMKAAAEAAKKHAEMVKELQEGYTLLFDTLAADAGQKWSADRVAAAKAERVNWEATAAALKAAKLDGRAFDSNAMMGAQGDGSVTAGQAAAQSRAFFENMKAVSTFPDPFEGMLPNLGKVNSLVSGMKTSLKGLWEGLSGGNGLSGVFSNLGKGIMDGFGQLISGGISSLIGGGINLAVKGVGALVGKLFGGEGKKTNDARDLKLDDFGGGDAFRKLAAEAGVADAELRKVFDTKKVKDFDVAFDAVAGKIKSFGDKQAADQTRLNQLVKDYGFTIEELGPKMAGQQLGAQAADITDKFRIMTEVGMIPAANVLAKMAEEVNGFVAQSKRAGIEVPASMRGILEGMVEQGLLTDEAGNKLTDLSTIPFAETLTQGIDRVVEAIGELKDVFAGLGSSAADIAGQIQASFSGISVPTISIPYELSGGGFPGVDVTPFAEGGIVTGPTVGLVGEAGPEAVLPLDRLGNLGNNASLHESIDQLASDIDRYNRTLPEMLAHALMTRGRR